MMIVKVHPNTAKTCIRIRPPTGDTPPRHCLSWVVRVQRVHCAKPQLPRYNCRPSCWAMGDPVAAEPVVSWPLIEYPAFDFDDDGRLCFYWDDKLLASAPGRYGAVVYDSDSVKIAQFEIDLRGGELIVDQATTVIATTTCEDC